MIHLPSRTASRVLSQVKRQDHLKGGFTLIELLLVVGIIGALASVVMEAIGPGKMLLSAKDATRKQMVKELQNALMQYQIDEGTLPSIGSIVTAPDGAQPVCKFNAADTSNCVDLDALVPEYLAAIPQDTSETNTNFSGYKIYRESGGRAQIYSTHLGGYADGLVGYWRFYEGAGTTVADSTGNGRTGTLTNSPIWVNGKLGKGLQFDGVNDFVAVNDHDSLDVTNAMTISAWVYWSSSGVREMILKNNNANTGYGQYELYQNNTYVSFRLMGASSTLTTSTPLSLNAWHHVAAVWDGTRMKIFLDGVPDNNSVSYSGTPVSTTGRLTFGAYANGLYPFSGMFDEIRIYNRAISANEVAILARGQQD
ncbi:MAG: LamG-like jellyroll fold domain-containing protein [Candidatus Peribacteraceae bacterium]|jgi:prepilin-type N-terminal cleavage/methylation domain-containing protein